MHISRGLLGDAYENKTHFVWNVGVGDGGSNKEVTCGGYAGSISHMV
jgi:hypothetical protein